MGQCARLMQKCEHVTIQGSVSPNFPAMVDSRGPEVTPVRPNFSNASEKS